MRMRACETFSTDYSTFAQPTEMNTESDAIGPNLKYDICQKDVIHAAGSSSNTEAQYA
jgi:hypothetical protein